MIVNKFTTFTVDYLHYSHENWANVILNHYCKYEPFLRKAIYELLQRVRGTEEIEPN